jgi:hypothetical protein
MGSKVLDQLGKLWGGVADPDPVLFTPWDQG